MEYRQLGKDGPQVSVLGLGAWPIGGGMGEVDERMAIATIHAAIDNGITLVDTAQGYRTSETVLGKALKGGYRERCFLATKVSGDYSREGITRAMNASLEALKVDSVDLYQIHSWNPAYPIEESMKAMARLQQEGKTRFLGVSNFNVDQMAQALQVTRFHSNQPAYNLFDRDVEHEELEFCAREGIGVLAHSALAKGLLTGKYTPHHTFPADDERSSMPRFQGELFMRYLRAAEQLEEVAQAKGLSLVQLAIAWMLRLPTATCVLVGAKNPEQVEEHAGAVGVRFTEDELGQIDIILRSVTKPE
jgi:aryl-alcohol dehydrogenase-like predicted oxidoreductase